MFGFDADNPDGIGEARASAGKRLSVSGPLH